ncbi:PREDICTED: transcription and mRNA export factor ENY2-like [Amphimedon queenslandica]|nr:PREDICTED: transcription and mRNA export factor ENY2-like [Amphimedon queenslandica]|eukprot:XP_003390505.1 PREDICTED: transcription and mRNA export factor ENY2-like [Amphimedon queenslandica]
MSSDYQNEKKKRELQKKNQINQKFEETGEKERLKELLRMRLRESGWRDKLREHGKVIIDKRGLNNVTVDSLVEEMTPKARELVPDYVKKELLQHIREYIEKNM